MAVKLASERMGGGDSDVGRTTLFWEVPLPPECILFVDSPDSEAFSCLSFALENSTIIAMDAEWKPIFDKSASTRPRVSILQIACRLQTGGVRKFWKGLKRGNSRQSGKGILDNVAVDGQSSLIGCQTEAGGPASRHGSDDEGCSSSGEGNLVSSGVEICESYTERVVDLEESGQIEVESGLPSRLGSDDEAHSSGSSEFIHTSGMEDSELVQTSGIEDFVKAPDSSSSSEFVDVGGIEDAELVQTIEDFVRSPDLELQQSFETRGKSDSNTNVGTEKARRKFKGPLSATSCENEESNPTQSLSVDTHSGPANVPGSKILVGLKSSEKLNKEVSSSSVRALKGAEGRREIREEWEDRRIGVKGKEQNPRTWPEMIFILDLLALPLETINDMLKAVFVDARVLKIGFGFKQDLIALCGTFPASEAHGCFDKVEPYLDVKKLYQHLFQESSSFIHRGRRIVTGGDGLASISETILGLPLAKEMQCSNWEQRPLTSEQFDYAAADAYCLLAIVDALQVEAAKAWFSPGVAGDDEDFLESGPKIGVAGLLTPTDGNLVDQGQRNASVNICHPKRGNATLMVEAALERTGYSAPATHSKILNTLKTQMSEKKTLGIEVLVRRLGEKLLISDQHNPTSKRVSRKTRSRRAREANKDEVSRHPESLTYLGPPPWDPAVGGDGIPKFLCDAMVEGLARQLRCVGIDAASPNSKKCEPRELVEIAEKEGRIILTRDVKLLRRRLVPTDLAYQVKRQGKWEQLAEILQTFKLSISEDQLLSRCTKCNGGFKRNPLTPKEAVEQALWSQIIPASALESVDTFWICSVCNHIYWQGFQFNRAYQQFAAICQTGQKEVVS